MDTKLSSKMIKQLFLLYLVQVVSFNALAVPVNKSSDKEKMSTP
ncbi:MAG: hypothetical protein AAF770_03975 [Bacteroidota bacterium]